MKAGFEIERKFLIEMPETGLLAGCKKIDMVQTYLTGRPGVSARVRKSVCADKTVYTKTEKKKISNMRRVEKEAVISENAYRELIKNADPERRTIYKTRYCLLYMGKCFEVDIYPFWQKQAVMEIELSDETEVFAVPEKIRIIREVTEDKRYTNASIAREIPTEDE